MDLPHSGAALIIADHLADVVESLRSSASNVMNTPVQVNAILFGTDLVADKKAVESVQRKVEIRVIALSGDTWDLFPCPVTLSCDESLLTARTGLTSGIQYAYESLPGKIQPSLQDMTGLGGLWNSSELPLQLAAIKDCGLSCWLTNRVCPQDQIENRRCQNCPSFVGNN